MTRLKPEYLSDNSLLVILSTYCASVALHPRKVNMVVPTQCPEAFRAAAQGEHSARAGQCHHVSGVVPTDVPTWAPQQMRAGRAGWDF